MISGAIIAAFYESISKLIYTQTTFKRSYIIIIINNFKVGVLYGLFVDAFKLGS